MGPRTAAIGFSLAIHALAVGLLAISFGQQPQPLGTPNVRPEAVEAVVVEDARVQEELRRLRNTEQAKLDAEEARQRRAQQELEQARRAKEEENKRLATLKQQREQERIAAEQQSKHLAELKAQQAQLEKEHSALEKKRQEEQKRLADTEKKRKEEEAKAMKAEADRKMRENIAAEKTRLEQARRKQLGKLANQYELAIQDKVRRNWLRPAGSAAEFECRVAIKQLPGGEVASVQVTESCGNVALDRSVEAAVRKASPLPSPPVPELFDKDLNLIFKP